MKRISQSVVAVIIATAFGAYAETTILVPPPIDPSKPPVVENVQTMKNVGSVAKWIRDKLQSYVSNSQIEERMQSISEGLGSLKEGEGVLVKVDIYKTSEGIIPSNGGTKVLFVGQGASQQEIAEESILRGSVATDRPAGTLKSAENSYLIWVVRKNGEFLTSTVPYPFAEKLFTDANARIEARRAEEIRKAEEAKKIEQAKKAEDARKALESAQRTREQLQQIEQARKAQEAAEQARKAREAAEQARKAQEAADQARKALEAAEQARRQAESVRIPLR